MFDIILGYVLLCLLAISSLAYGVVCLIERVKSWKEKSVFSNIAHLIFYSLFFVISIGSFSLVVILALP